jgi:hypothetical protein
MALEDEQLDFDLESMVDDEDEYWTSRTSEIESVTEAIESKLSRLSGHTWNVIL